MRMSKLPQAGRIAHSLSVAQQHRATQHMQQQCWLWGCDIRHHDGNLLLAYGFTRHRPTNPTYSSLYALPTANYHVLLWGFGMYVGNTTHGGAFIFRHTFTPLAVAHPALSTHTPDDVIRGACVPTTHHQDCTAAALAWIGTYEAWVVQRMGIAYRQQSIASWPKTALQTPYSRFITDWHQYVHAVGLPLDISATSSH